MKQKDENLHKDELIETIAALAVLETKEDYKSNLEPFSVYAEKIRSELTENLNLGFNSFINGYQTLIEELKKPFTMITT